MKTCNKCLQNKELSEFAIQKLGKLGRRASCKECVISVYRRTREGVILGMHAGQRAKSIKRCDVPPSYSKEELKQWVLSQEAFEPLYQAWVASGYDMQYAVTCDRLSDYLTYTLDNIQLLSFRDNTLKYQNDAKEGSNTKLCFPVIQLTLDGIYVNEYHSVSAAARAVNSSQSNIRNVCEQKPIKRTESDGSIRWSTPKSAKGFIWRYAP